MVQLPSHIVHTTDCIDEAVPPCGHRPRQVHVHIYRSCSTGCASQGTLLPEQENPVNPRQPEELPVSPDPDLELPVSPRPDLELPAPEVLEALDSVLMLKASGDATVRVKYVGMAGEHLIVLELSTEDRTQFSLGRKQGDAVSGYVDFPLPREVLISLINECVQLRYWFDTPDLRNTSPDTVLTIQAPELPVPEIAKAVDGVLKIGSAVGVIEIRSKPWDFIQENQERYFACTLKNKSGGLAILK